MFRPSRTGWPLAARVGEHRDSGRPLAGAAGDIGAGLIAVLSLLTADYGTDRPYANRAIQSAVIAGALGRGNPWGRGLRRARLARGDGGVGGRRGHPSGCVRRWGRPAGGYMFVLVCARPGSACRHPSCDRGRSTLLVLGGGATAWTAQMSPALIDRRGPEKRALSRAETPSRLICTPPERRRPRRPGNRPRRRCRGPLGEIGRSSTSLCLLGQKPSPRLRDANHAPASDVRRRSGSGVDGFKGRRIPPPIRPARSGALEANPAVSDRGTGTDRRASRRRLGRAFRCGFTGTATSAG